VDDSDVVSEIMEIQRRLAGMLGDAHDGRDIGEELGGVSQRIGASRSMISS
jgi:hypothetical protein